MKEHQGGAGCILYYNMSCLHIINIALPGVHTSFLAHSDSAFHFKLFLDFLLCFRSLPYYYPALGRRIEIPEFCFLFLDSTFRVFHLRVYQPTCQDCLTPSVHLILCNPCCRVAALSYAVARDSILLQIRSETRVLHPVFLPFGLRLILSQRTVTMLLLLPSPVAIRLLPPSQ